MIAAVRKHVRASVAFTKGPVGFPSCDTLYPHVQQRNAFSSGVQNSYINNLYGSCAILVFSFLLQLAGRKRAKGFLLSLFHKKSNF